MMPLHHTLTITCFILTWVRVCAAQPVATHVDTENSVISYTGNSVLHGFTGVSRAITGALTVDLARPERSAMTISAPVASFDSGNGRRDNDMLEAVHADQYPDVTFVSMQVTPASDETWNVVGSLTFHGETQRIEVPVHVSAADSTFVAQGHFELSLTDYGVRRPRLLFAPIGDIILIEFTIYAPL